jgi:hypothetical protein
VLAQRPDLASRDFTSVHQFYDGGGNNHKEETK